MAKMSQGAKIALIVAGIIGLILLSLVAGGVWWWQTKGKVLLEQGQKAAIAGEKFGKRTDEQGCLDHALNRLDVCTDISCEIYNSVFLANCLHASERTPRFCQGVPLDSEIVRSAKWRLAACKKRDRKGQRCPRMMSIVQKHCHQTDKP